MPKSGSNAFEIIQNIRTIIAGRCHDIDCDDIPFNGGCMDCTVTRIKQALENYKEAQ